MWSPSYAQVRDLPYRYAPNIYGRVFLRNGTAQGRQTGQMKSISELEATLREVDKSRYPELSNYTKNDIWRDIGPGGLYLVSLLVKELSLRPNSLVLDLVQTPQPLFDFSQRPDAPKYRKSFI